MAESITVDFSIVTRRKRRAQADSKRYWDVRYAAYRKAGFTHKEAQWGADSNLPLRRADVKRLIKRRKENVAWLMDRFGYSRAKAIRQSAKDLKAKLKKEAIDELNIFYEILP